MKISPSKVRSARERAMLSQDEVAELVGTSGFSVWRWEHGEEPVGIRPGAARRLHEALKVQPGSLMAEEATSVPLAQAAPVLDPWSMLAEKDGTRRAEALEAATDEERARYAAELDEAINRADLALFQDAGAIPAAEDEKPAQRVRTAKLKELRNFYVILRNEAEPYVPPEVGEARELVGYAS